MRELRRDLSDCGQYSADQGVHLGIQLEAACCGSICGS